jgi:hypothetical protein
MSTSVLFREHEPAYRAQYGELKERTRRAGPLLPGTPGSLYLRKGTGHAYWYRVYYPVPGKQAETLVGCENDAQAENTMRTRMADAESTARQIGTLRKLGFQVADKFAARLLVELHNLGAFDAGLVLAGALGTMAWLNELGLDARSRRKNTDSTTQGIELAAPLSFLTTPQAAMLPFIASPDLAASATVTLPGMSALLVAFYVPGEATAITVQPPGLAWQSQTVAHGDYLLDTLQAGALLAGGHCIPVRLPQPARLVWHALYAGSQFVGQPDKTSRYQTLALTLAAALVEQDPWALLTAWDAAPATIGCQLRRQRETLLAESAGHPELQELLADCLRPGS